MTAVHPRAEARPRRAGPGGARATVRATVGAYVALTKPRIIELLLVTTLPAMVLAQRGVPPPGLVAATLVGGTLAAGSAHALNQVLERDIDAVMHRTERRPVARAAVSPRAALVYGLALLVVALGIMLVWVNPLAAGLTAAANAFYLLVYTVWLKRRTPQNIVWGGAAGCMPTLIGWAAVTGSLAWTPLVLFLVVFFWTPPHYWPLAMRFREDYARAGVPMLPVVARPAVVARRIVAYSWAMVAASLALWPVAGTGWAYPVVAAAAGAWFLAEAYRLLGRARRGGPLAPMRLFHGSITYLTVVFVAVVADVLLLG